MVKNSCATQYFHGKGDTFFDKQKILNNRIYLKNKYFVPFTEIYWLFQFNTPLLNKCINFQEKKNTNLTNSKFLNGSVCTQYTLHTRFHHQTVQTVHTDRDVV